MKPNARIIIAAMLMALPVSAWAHVKWFVNYNASMAPESLAFIASSTSFWALLVFATAVIFATSVVDRNVLSLTDCPRFQPLIARAQNGVPGIMHWGIGAFFLVLGAFYPNVILTPELIVANPWLVYVHLAIAITAVSRKTSVIAGCLILFLYSYAVQLYGAFHMLDYLLFVALAIYLITQNLLPTGANARVLALLRLVLCYSFLWGGVEKFMQPNLYYQLLANHPYLAMGLDWAFFVRGCGFVELCLVWHIYSGKLAGYASIAVFALIAVLAFIPFGLTDVVGHFAFIIPLVAILLTPRKTVLFRSATANTAAFLGLLLFLLLFGAMSHAVLQFNTQMH
ncbi:hypothetical protein AAEY27_20810 [Kosakonia sp. BYX6]|uniref:Uncharacterized protein n=1 Tax=Kosakonia calanthes TaxID=3139408 RepID=A0ABZ3B3Y1_9ENTR